MTLAPGPAGAPGRPGAGPRPRIDLSDLAPRLASGLVMVAAALATAVAGGPVFLCFWLAAGFAILWEWQRLIGSERLGWRVAVGAAAVTLATVGGSVGAGVALLLAGTVAAIGRARPALSGAGVLYAASLPFAIDMLRNSEVYGLEAVFWLFATVWGTDIMAYFGGRLIGGPKLWPRLSPSKTWSGFLIGVASGAFAGLAVASVYGRAYWPLLPLGVGAGIAAQAGDLFESSLKRHFGVKDSSRLIPGHGGVMDRLDGFIAAAVFAGLVGLVRLGPGASAAGLLQW